MPTTIANRACIILYRNKDCGTIFLLQPKINRFSLPLYVIFTISELVKRETTTKLLYLEAAHPGLPQPKKAELFCVLRFFYVASINLMQFVTTMCNLIVHTQVQICQHHQSTTKYTSWLGCPPCNVLEYHSTPKILYLLSSKIRF